LLRTAERDRPFGALYEGGTGIAHPDGHVVDHHAVGAERVRQPDPYLLAAQADVDDLAQRLVVESGAADERRRAPGADPRLARRVGRCLSRHGPR